MSEDFSPEEHKKVVREIKERTVGKYIRQLEKAVFKDFPMFKDLIITGPDSEGQLTAKVTMSQPLERIVLEVHLADP